MWEDASNKITYNERRNYLVGNQLDSVMGYPFRDNIVSFLKGNITSKELNNKFMTIKENYPKESFKANLNLISSHDVARIKTELHYDEAMVKLAVATQMTFEGVPYIYYGDEAGVCGWTDPDNRRTYPWGSEDRELIAFHKAAIAMHKSQEVLKTGSYKPLVGEYNLIAYGRFNTKDAVVVIVNNSEDERRVRVPVWELGITDKDEMEQIFVTFDGGFGEEQLWYTVNGGWLDIGLRKTSAVVLKRVKW